MPDQAIWTRARELDACVITKDEDFILLQALDSAGPAVVWIRIGNAIRSVLLQRVTHRGGFASAFAFLKPSADWSLSPPNKSCPLCYTCQNRESKK